MSCECERCDFCDGRSYLWRSVSGTITKYRCDDLDDLEDCPQCRGSGILAICRDCLDAMEGDE